MNFFEKIKLPLKGMVRIKVYMTRASGYLNMFNSSMIIYLVLNKLNIDARQYYIPLLVLGAAALVTWGYIEDRLGLWVYEQSVSQDRSKLNKEILERVKRIEEKLK